MFYACWMLLFLNKYYCWAPGTLAGCVSYWFLQYIVNTSPVFSWENDGPPKRARCCTGRLLRLKFFFEFFFFRKIVVFWPCLVPLCPLFSTQILDSWPCLVILFPEFCIFDQFSVCRPAVRSRRGDPLQTGECFLLTFDLGRQEVNNKNNHGIGQISHGSATEWINHRARPQKLQTTSWNVLLRLVARLRHCWHVD